MSKQTSFTLMLLLAFSVVVPGSAGYLSVKMEAIGQAHRELVTLENRIRGERLAARIRKVERNHRERRLQPIISSRRESCDSSGRSRAEPRTRPPGLSAVVPVPVAGTERRQDERPRARGHVVRKRVPQGQGPSTRERGTRGRETPGQGVPEPARQGLAAQGRPEAAFPERWSQLERRGGRHREGEDMPAAPDALTAPDAFGVESLPEGTGTPPVEASPSVSPQPVFPQPGTRAR
ncbi:hypothetical protein ABT352_04965 [Streptosporangium sp. NPDC000563]|uniref:hypothetical protein n=1 Tax=Streptosporangium sp. NPDC000563 TaxID=3154366 RepID=UPI003327ADE3